MENNLEYNNGYSADNSAEWLCDSIDETEEPVQVKKQLRKVSNLNSLQLFIYYAFIELVGYVISVTGVFDKIESEPLRMLISYTISHPITISLLVFLFVAITKRGLHGMLRKPEKPVKWILKWIVIGVGFSYASNYLIVIIGTIISAIIGNDMNTVSFISEGTLSSAVVYFVVLAIFAPIFEELLFRGSLLSRTAKFGSVFSAIVVGTSFGIWHLNIQQLTYAAVMGMVATYMAVKSRSIIPAVLLHFVLNFIGAVQSALLPQINLEEMQDDEALKLAIEQLLAGESSYSFSEIFCACAVMVISGICLLSIIGAIIIVAIEFSLHREKFKITDCCKQLTLGKKLLVYITAPVTLLFIVVGLIYSTIQTFG